MALSNPTREDMCVTIHSVLYYDDSELPVEVRYLLGLSKTAQISITAQGPVYPLVFDFTRFEHGVSWTKVKTLRIT